MGTINRTNMDKQQITQFFVKTSGGGLRQLPFLMVKIDYDDTFYMPVEVKEYDENFRRIRGTFTAPVILDQNRALPIPTANDNKPDRFPCFEYHGL